MRAQTPNILDAVLSGAGAAQPAATKVAIKNIINDGGTQMRASLNFETVSEYAEAMMAGVLFPPITLYYDGETYWLADGFHRLQAWKSIYQVAGSAGTYDPAEVPAIVHAGTRRDAILHAAGANANHGLRRTNEDKRRAVEVLLRDPEWSQWSDRVIAEACAVSNKFVSSLRNKMTVNGTQSPTERKGADGRTINTQNIGSNRPAPARMEIYEIEAVVRSVASERHATASDLRTIAKQRIGKVWQLCLQELPAGIPYRELTQAMHNVASQMEQQNIERAQQPPAAADPAEAQTVADPLPPVPDDLAAAGWELRGTAYGRFYLVNERTSQITRSCASADKTFEVARGLMVGQWIPEKPGTTPAPEPATVIRHPQHDDLFEFSELFKLAIEETHRWAHITGEHTAILEAERGLRHLVQRTAAILDGFTGQP